MICNASADSKDLSRLLKIIQLQQFLKTVLGFFLKGLTNIDHENVHGFRNPFILSSIMYLLKNEI